MGSGLSDSRRISRQSRLRKTCKINFCCDKFSQARGAATPEVRLGLDDLAAAYRTIPTSQPQYNVIGVVVYDAEPTPGNPRGRFFYASAVPPDDVLALFEPDLKTYIAQLELLAAVSVYYSYPAVFRGRDVHHFIDNTIALSALVHGYAGKADLARMTNVFHKNAAAALRRVQRLCLLLAAAAARRPAGGRRGGAAPRRAAAAGVRAAARMSSTIHDAFR